MSAEQATSSQVCEDEDNVSVGTIYESIDNLVLQFDDAIRNMGENIKPGAKNSKSTKKKERSIFRQHSFLSSRKSSKSNLWSEKRAEFEKGERYSGFLLKRSTGGSWKKKWCVLKGCIFGYYKYVQQCVWHTYSYIRAQLIMTRHSSFISLFPIECGYSYVST